MSRLSLFLLTCAQPLLEINLRHVAIKAPSPFPFRADRVPAMMAVSFTVSGASTDWYMVMLLISMLGGPCLQETDAKHKYYLSTCL